MYARARTSVKTAFGGGAVAGRGWGRSRCRFSGVGSVIHRRFVPRGTPRSRLCRFTGKHRNQPERPPADIVPRAVLEPHAREDTGRAKAEALVQSDARRVRQGDPGEQGDIAEVAQLGAEPLKEKPTHPSSTMSLPHVHRAVGRPAVARPPPMPARTCVADDDALGLGDEPGKPRTRDHPAREFFAARCRLFEGDGGTGHDGGVDREDVVDVRIPRRPDGRRRHRTMSDGARPPDPNPSMIIENMVSHVTPVTARAVAVS